MTDPPRSAARAPSRRPRRLHPLPLRIMHWTNAVAMIIMIGSGWKIYNDEVLFGWLHFPDWITIGGEAQGALQWHFLAMWILVLNGIAYLVYGCFTGRFRRMLCPDPAARADRRPSATRCVSTSRTTISPATTPCRAALCRHHPGRYSAGDLGSGDLEADAVLRADGAVLRLPGRAPGAFPRHGRDRAVPLSCTWRWRCSFRGRSVAMVTGGPCWSDRRVPHAGARSRARHGRRSERMHDVRTPSPSIFRPAAQSIRASSRRTRRSSRRSTAASCCAARSASARCRC